jgi:translation initiation factor IF-1
MTVIMARNDLLELEGVVTKALGFGLMEVSYLDVTIKARKSGKLLNRNIKVMVGDRVKVGVSPYDPSHGIITWRF